MPRLRLTVSVRQVTTNSRRFRRGYGARLCITALPTVEEKFSKTAKSGGQGEGPRPVPGNKYDRRGASARCDLARRPPRCYPPASKV